MQTTEIPALTISGVGLGLTAFLVSLGFCSWMKRLGHHFLVNFPGGALRHQNAIPLTGGIAFWGSTVSVYLLAALVCAFGQPLLPGAIGRYVAGAWYRSGELGVILGLSTLMMLAGLLIDLFEPGWKLRLLIQLPIAIALAVFGPRLTLFWPFTHPLLGGLVTVLWVICLVNAFAFLDNMDGLAVGIGLIASVLFAATQIQVGSLFAPAALIIVAGGLGGVLVYNHYPARLFFGHSGSWFLGFMLAALTIAGTYYRYDGQSSRNGVLSPLLIMAVPFYESAVVFLVWFSERDQPFLYNPRHFSYRLQAVGLSPKQSVRLLFVVALGAGLGSLLLRNLDAFGTIVLLGQISCLIIVVGIIEASAIRRKRTREPGDDVTSPTHSPAGDVGLAVPRQEHD